MLLFFFFFFLLSVPLRLCVETETPGDKPQIQV